MRRVQKRSVLAGFLVALWLSAGVLNGTAIAQTNSSAGGASEEMFGADEQVGAETGSQEGPGRTRLIDAVQTQPGQATLVVDGKVTKYRHFTLASPARLVVDLYDSAPLFKERAFAAEAGFNQIRVGVYKDRTRFVFDAESGTLPTYAVNEQHNTVVVSWGAEQAPTPTAQVKSGPGKVSVDAINFDKDNGKSQLSIELSSTTEVIPVVQQGNVVRFGVKDASLPQALRRTFDSSSFPSAVLRATPYTVLVGNRQDVRFAVELKGQVAYQLVEQGNRLNFIVDDGAFVEPAVSVEPKFPVPLAGATSIAAMDEQAMGYEGGSRTLGAEEREHIYTGEKVRLVFDDADVRDIFQLIAEVSDLNIIVSEEVKGAVSLRLIDVPWDQALDLILEMRDLGMMKKGNVVRILPKEQIRTMEESKFTAARNKEKLEDLVTEVIPVSYTDLKNVVVPIKEILSERGKVTEDNRNKQLIVTDIKTVLSEVINLVKILDTPERQVMIEARIVEANSNFQRRLGVAWGLSYTADGNSGSPTKNVSEGLVFGGGGFLIPPNITNDGVSGIGSSITFGRLGIDSTTLSLRLSASEAAGDTKIISQPRVTTLNNEKAIISQGRQIPYKTVSQDGTKTEFKDALLSLEVTPIINPDNSIILSIIATNDQPIGDEDAVEPPISKKTAKTKVLVMDGETTVIGGVFVEDLRDTNVGIPLLKDIPFIGNLFKSTTKTRDRAELLIFITPRIVN